MSAARTQARFEDLARIHNMICDVRTAIYKTRTLGVSLTEDAVLIDVSADLGSPMLKMSDLIDQRRAS